MLQDIHEESAIQKYPIGIGIAYAGRVLHYAKFTHAVNNVGCYRLAVSTDQILQVNDRLSVAPAKIIGDKTVVVDVVSVGAPGGGMFQGGVVTLDELVGGSIEVWPVAGGNQFMYRKIVRNTAVSGGNITITVDKPFNFAIGVGSGVTIHPNIYRAVKSAVDAGLAGFQSAVGIPLIPITNGYFAWLITYGRCFVAPTGVWPGAAANFRDAYLHSDGCINSSLGETIGGGAANNSPQRVGYVVNAGNYGSAEIMLQLDPTTGVP